MPTPPGLSGVQGGTGGPRSHAAVDDGALHSLLGVWGRMREGKEEGRKEREEKRKNNHNDFQCSAVSPLALMSC